jgi:oxygen-dependent protoporphyrinogen oxidase
MTRIAILGGGISGLTAAYELELARKRGASLDWHLYEATDRLGGIIQTTRHTTPEGDYILEGGPDGWVSEKPWARELAAELGLEDQLIYSNDATRKMYILRNHQLVPVPDHMRLMVPEDLSALDSSPLFTESAKKAYANELNRADELKVSAPLDDESVASFVLRHSATRFFKPSPRHCSAASSAAMSKSSRSAPSCRSSSRWSANTAASSPRFNQNPNNTPSHPNPSSPASATA